MLNEQTLLTINSSQDICDATKHATKLYLESNEIFNGNTMKEDSWAIEKSVIQEKLNTEIKNFFNFDFENITSLKSSIFAATITPGVNGKPVFAKAINNRYFEKVTTVNHNGVCESHGINISEEVSKSIQNISKLLDENADLKTIRTKLNRIHNIINESILNVLDLTRIDLDTIETLLIPLFGGNHSQAFFLFVEHANNIENLSSVVFSSVTLKICAKLSPLLATQFLMHYKTNNRMLDFFERISNKIKFQSSLTGKSTLFFKTHIQKITYGFIGVTLGSLLGYQFSSSAIAPKNEIILPVVRHFVDAMKVITANSKLITYTCSKHSGELIDAFYRGFRETFIESGLELLNHIKDVVTKDSTPTNKRSK